MRASPLICAAALIITSLPAPSLADGMPAGTEVQRPHRQVHHWRHHRVKVPVMARRYWNTYPMTVPSPWNPGYDRAMVLNYRTPVVSGEYLAEGGLPPTPAVSGSPYFYRSGAAVYEYDGMADAWIQLSQHDTRHALPGVR